ncbi:MAG: sugar transferase [Clostridiales bacterium]|nr:sugar transferase [Clostridiales bacterium]
MYKQKRKGWSKHFDFILLDIILLEIAFLISYGIRHSWNITHYISYYLQAGIYLAMISICAGMIRRSYSGILRRDYLQELKNVVIHVSIVEIALIVVAFFTKGSDYYSREVFVLFWILGSGLCFFGHIFWKIVVHRWMFWNKEKRRMLVISMSGQIKTIIKKLTSQKYIDYSIAGIVLTDEKWEGYEVEGYPVIGRLADDIQDILHQYVIDEIYIYLYPDEYLDRKYIDFFIQTGMTVHIDLEGLAKLEAPAYLERLAGQMVVTSSMKMATPGEYFLKRMMDIIGGLIGLILTGIASIFVVPAIKLADPGPAFFSQIRVGKTGDVLKCISFAACTWVRMKRKKS